MIMRTVISFVSAKIKYVGQWERCKIKPFKAYWLRDAPAV